MHDEPAAADRPSHSEPPRRTWTQRFVDGFRGGALAVRKDSAFRIHLAVAAAVIVAAAVLRANLLEWCLLALCIGTVLGAEMFNTALEHLAKAVTKEHDPNVGAALDMACAAVLIVALAAAVVGCLVLGSRLLVWLEAA